jgi:hypothetical protein
MDKQALLQELSGQIAAGHITKQDITPLLQDTTEHSENNRASLTQYFTINNIFYLLGTIIVVLGLVFFVAQLWDDIGTVGRILVTFGLGMTFAGIGSTLIDTKKTSLLGSVFHLIGAVLLPGGMFVTLDELQIDITNPWLVTTIFAVLTAFYALLSYIHRRNVLYLLTIIPGTIFFYALTEAIIAEPFYDHPNTYAYLTMIIGVSYLVLADGMRTFWSRYLVGILNAAGSFGIFAAAFSQVFDSFFWELIFVPLLIAGIYWSTFTQSRSILAFSSLFVFIYVSYITNEYFADSLGWPISLVLLGFIFLCMGYFSLRLNREYIAPHN